MARVNVLATAGTGTWTVPAGVTSVTVELLGAGGDGISGSGGEIATGSSAGAGLYAKYINVPVTPGSSVAFQVGVHGGTSDSPGTPGTADTWFSSALTMFAMGGTTGANALGGFRTAGSPAIAHAGGSTSSTADFVGCPGGGGAGGPNGVGGKGEEVELFPFNSGGTGGGGANGGTNSPASTGAPGSNGGQNRHGTGAGVGALSSAVDGTPGANGAGGGGGYGGGGSGNHSAGGTGSWEPLWTDSDTGLQYGPSSGAGGPGYSANEPVDGANASSASPDGGGRGGGGGGTAGIATPGIGDNGLIVLSYTPEPARGRVYTRYRRVRKATGSIPPPPPPPANTGAPFMNQARVGVVSTCSPGTWTGTLPMTFAYQWMLDGSPISGQTSSVYTPAGGDDGHSLSCTVTATNIVGSASKPSNALTVSDGSWIAVPNLTALQSVLADPASAGKQFLLAATAFGSIPANNIDFSANPITISGTLPIGSTTATNLGLTNSSGMTWENIVFNDADPGGYSVYIYNSNPAFNSVLTFNNIVSDSGLAQGSQSGGGWYINNMPLGSITINGQNDAAKPDIFGRSSSIAMTNSNVTLLVNNITIDNAGTDGIIGGSVQNVTLNRVLIMNQYFGPGDHPDAIQFFQSPGGQIVDNLTITNCGIFQGAFGMGMQGIFLANCSNTVARGNWVFEGAFLNAFANADGTGLLYDDNFAQGWTTGGLMITRGGYVNATATSNTINEILNYAGDGVNPGYVPDPLPGTNTIIPAASGSADFSQLDPWLAAHPTARARPA